LDLLGQRLGLKVRHARHVRGLTLKDLAVAAECSESMLSKIETNRVTPSLPLLQRLTTALGINIAALFDEKAAEGPIARAGNRPLIEVDTLRSGPGIMLERLIPYSEAHLLQANIHIVAAGGSSNGTISHLGEEIGYVLQGSLDLNIDGNSYHLAEGDSFYFRSDIPHGYRNPGSETAKILWINTPPTF
jgi:transcriptional regulator with XRE-family HTH domain